MRRQPNQRLHSATIRGADDAQIPRRRRGISGLQQEYVATLAQLKRYGDLITYADKVLADGAAMDDHAHAKIYNAPAVAQYGQRDLKGAADMLGVSLKHNNTSETQNFLKQIQDALAAGPN